MQRERERERGLDIDCGYHILRTCVMGAHWALKMGVDNVGFLGGEVGKTRIRFQKRTTAISGIEIAKQKAR